MFEAGEEQAKLIRRMSKEAIALAMQGRWREAVSVNQSIVESVPTDVDAYNRLGKAYIELGEFSQAKEAYTRALELAPNNSIATKNLNRLSQLQNTQVAVKDERPKAAPHLFIGEVGKAGVVNLVQMAANDVLAQMTAGDQVYLKVSSQKLFVENERGEYLGMVEPQHGFRLAKLMDGGNQYSATIVSVDDNRVKVMIRAVFKHAIQIGMISFPSKEVEVFKAHVNDNLLRNRTAEEEFID
ncbi:MAG: tetratricopeptide repeat protein, partial [Dehalococcoidia bacterium]